MEQWKATKVIAPNWHKSDNEVPKELDEAIREHNCTLELYPPDMHWQNIVEQAIQTTKNLISGWATG